MSPRPGLRRLALCALGAVAVGLGCRDGTGPDVPVLVVEPPQATVQHGQTVQLTATLEDANGDPLPTSGVIWTSSNVPVAEVSATGLVTARVPGGPVTITAIVGSTTGRTTVSVTSGPPASVAILTQPSSSAQSGVALGQQPSVRVQDSGGYPVPAADVTASIASGDGTLGGTTTIQTNSSGVATFTDLSIIGLAGDRTLLFTAGSATQESDAVALSAGTATELVITTQPSSNATNATPFAQQPTVRARDGATNPVSGVSITAAIQTGGGTLGGTTTVSTDASGVATFTNLAITGTTGVRTLRFSTTGSNVTSSGIDVGPGAPSSVLIITQPPQNALDGVVFTRSPVIVVQDVSGNAVPGQNVSASVVSGGGTLGGTTTVSTGGSGSATFSSLSIIANDNPGARTLRFTAGAAQTDSDDVAVAYAVGTYPDVPYCTAQAQQHMDVYVPSNSFARPLPVAAFIHGGGWVGGDKADGVLFEEVRDELLPLGYVVVSLNYRLATASTNKWPAQINDVKCAIRDLRANAGDYGFDGQRVAVWGVSVGGHLASMLGVTGSGVFEGSGGFSGESSDVMAVVAVGGISDLTGGPTHPELDFGGPEDTFSSWPGPSAELTNASPISYETSGDAPILLVHGDQDTTVFPAQAQRLFDQLNAVGANPTLQWVTNGGHNLDDVGMGPPSPSISQITQQIVDFFEDHLFGDP